MYRPYSGAGPEPIAFLLIPKFSAMAFFSAIEPLRVANRLAGRPLFSWQALSLDGAPVEASNGMRLVVDGAIEDVAAAPTLIVCAGFDPGRYESKSLLAELRRRARAGVTLGALDTGAHVLATAKLLAGVRVTMHWEAVAAFREEFPGIDVSDELFEVAGAIFTCAGGTAALDLMLDMIGRKHGTALAVAVSEQFIHDRIRASSDHQRMTLSTRLHVTNAKVLSIVRSMEANLEPIVDLAGLARDAGISPRQMERLFRTCLATSPAAYYRGLRLKRAQELLRQTDLSVIEIAMATGFSSDTVLSRRYREHFGITPRADRRDPSIGGSAAITLETRDAAATRR